MTIIDIIGLYVVVVIFVVAIVIVWVHDIVDGIEWILYSRARIVQQHCIEDNERWLLGQQLFPQESRHVRDAESRRHPFVQRLETIRIARYDRYTVNVYGE